MMPCLVLKGTNPHAHKQHIVPWHSALVKNSAFTAFNGKRRGFFFHRLSPLTSIQNFPIPLKCILILSFYLRQGFLNDLFLAEFPTKNCTPFHALHSHYMPCPSPYRLITQILISKEHITLETCIETGR